MCGSLVRFIIVSVNYGTQNIIKGSWFFLCVLCVQFGLGGSKASFTPFVDPRVYQTSPGEDDDGEISAAGRKNLLLQPASSNVALM